MAIVAESTPDLLPGERPPAGYGEAMTVLRSILLFSLAEAGGAWLVWQASASTAAWPLSAPPCAWSGWRSSCMPRGPARTGLPATRKGRP